METRTAPLTETRPSNQRVEGLTLLVRHPLKMRRVEVTAVWKPTPRVVRVRLGGPDLADFISISPDDHVKVLFPAAGKREPVLPTVVDGRVIWPKGGANSVARDYTPICFERTAQSLEIEIVEHEGGLASTWASRAQVGDIVGIAGPRGSHVLQTPPRGLLLVGDETALPAIERWLSELPASTTALVVIEVTDKSDERALKSRAAVDVRWVHRGPMERGVGGALERAVSVCALPSPLSYAWVAGEAESVRAIRQHLVDDRGLNPNMVSARGYWKRGTRDHQEPHDD